MRRLSVEHSIYNKLFTYLELNLIMNTHTSEASSHEAREKFAIDFSANAIHLENVFVALDYRESFEVKRQRQP